MSTHKSLSTGIFLIIISAISTAIGQLFWKLGHSSYSFLVLGFVFYGIGALVMMLAFKHGEVSILHPMLSASYVFAIILGYFVLNEAISIAKISGIFLIFLGIVFLASNGKSKPKTIGTEG